MTTSRGEAAKERILETSLKLFETGGFKSLRIATICEAVGLSATSVYWHFGNKAGLVQAVLERAFSPMGTSMMDDIEAAPGPRQVSMFISHLRKLIHERPVGACSMLAFLQDESQKSEDVEAAINATRENELAGQIELMKHSLNLSKKQAKGLAITINACVNYAVMIKLVGGKDAEIEDVLDTLKQAIVSAAKGI